MTSRDPRFEIRDIHVGKLIALIGALLIVLGSSILVTRGFNHVFMKMMASHDQSAPSRVTHQEPPEPRLQENPTVELIRLRDTENVTLNTYAWVDPNAGTVRIPIERAMAILAERNSK